MSPFRVHYEITETTKRASMVVQATSPADAKEAVQEAYRGVRLIFHKVKIDRAGAA